MGGEGLGRRGLRWGLMAALMVMAGGGAAQTEPVQTLAGFRVPEYDRDGALKSELFGDLAQLTPDGCVRITNLRIDFFRDRRLEMRVTAPECRYDEKRKEAESEGPVKIARPNMVVTGVGFAWKAAKERLEIFRDAKVVLKGGARRHMEPPGPEGPNATRGDGTASGGGTP